MEKVVEDVAEMVETAGERVDKVAEEIGEHLPEGSKLQKAALFVENAAERIAKDADLAGDIIEKIEAAENELSSFIKQSGESKEEDDAKQKNDQTEALNEQSKEQSLN
ncbi:unnamed protein product [Citrullus colocynthis]|uniref:Uncharacterized protein n=1 Tax=Citrullus colocynthis TaxID=252529 RepID=A0ABP0XZB2_9ROSI